jgi:hypothetical protein
LKVAHRDAGIGVVILVVQREIADLDDFEPELRRIHPDQRHRELARNRFPAQAADQQCDFRFGCHGILLW